MLNKILTIMEPSILFVIQSLQCKMFQYTFSWILLGEVQPTLCRTRESIRNNWARKMWQRLGERDAQKKTKKYWKNHGREKVCRGKTDVASSTIKYLLWVQLERDSGWKRRRNMVWPGSDKNLKLWGKCYASVKGGFTNIYFTKSTHLPKGKDSHSTE